MATQKKEKRPHLGRGLESLLGPMGNTNQQVPSLANEFASLAKPADPQSLFYRTKAAPRQSG